MRLFPTLAAALTACALPAFADDFVMVESSGTVPETMAALRAAVEGAGAKVFAEVDHAGGAASVGMDLRPTQLMVFGNPKLGTPAIQDDQLAGYVLPLKVLVYEDADGKVFLAYEEVDDMFDGMNINDDAPYAKMMQGALGKLTAAAAGQ